MIEKVKCPTCRKRRERNKYFPFCSKRCKMADLYGWLSDSYRISEPIKGEPKEIRQEK